MCFRSAYDMAAIMFRGWDAETNNSPDVRIARCLRTCVAPVWTHAAYLLTCLFACSATAMTL